MELTRLLMAINTFEEGTLNHMGKSETLNQEHLWKGLQAGLNELIGYTPINKEDPTAWLEAIPDELINLHDTYMVILEIIHCDAIGWSKEKLEVEQKKWGFEPLLYEPDQLLEFVSTSLGSPIKNNTETAQKLAIFFDAIDHFLRIKGGHSNLLELAIDHFAWRKAEDGYTQYLTAKIMKARESLKRGGLCSEEVNAIMAAKREHASQNQ